MGAVTKSRSFNTFCNNIVLDNYEDMKTSAVEIAKKLISVYYDEQDSDPLQHLFIVGSVGRRTAIKGNSDLDIIFDLPNSVFTRFDQYETNGQSRLLQEVKEHLKERYPHTELKGDGQVVVIEFCKYTVELVPGFKQSDGRFKYPDSNNGGSWKYTNPLPEQSECKKCDDKSNNNFYNFCRIIRSWKNALGFKFGGILIDSLVYNHFNENDFYANFTKDDYLDIFKNLLAYLSKQDKNKEFWVALGSKQHVYNSCGGIFVLKADESLKKIENAQKNGDDLDEVLRELLGADYPVERKIVEKAMEEISSFSKTEQFIQNLFPVDIRYNLSLDCIVSENGFKDELLSKLLQRDLPKKIWLRHNKKLKFFIKEKDCPKPYDIYWKVRNVGTEAERRNCVRGQIIRTNSQTQQETTQFQGEHYVECYLVKNEVCVAKAHIDVPIGTF